MGVFPWSCRKITDTACSGKSPEIQQKLSWTHISYLQTIPFSALRNRYPQSGEIIASGSPANSQEAFPAGDAHRRICPPDTIYQTILSQGLPEIFPMLADSLAIFCATACPGANPLPQENIRTTNPRYTGFIVNPAAGTSPVSHTPITRPVLSAAEGAALPHIIHLL